MHSTTRPANQRPAPTRPAAAPVVISPADQVQRREIYRLRHQVYAEELRQHAPNPTRRLQDALDVANHYLVATVGGALAGFVSITPPTAGRYSTDKYISREKLPFAFDDGLFEVRLLTVCPDFRGSELAALLMYAAFRWVEARNGTRIIAIGRREIMPLYQRCGLVPLGITIQAGEVHYDFVTASVATLREHLWQFSGMLARLEGRSDWRLGIPFHRPATCFHGGEFFTAIGPEFDQLERRREVINADVLDAWFPPAPEVIRDVATHLPWLLRTSPPTACEGLVAAIATARGVAPGQILPGAGSSDLIFRAFSHWLTARSQVLILDPTYGEYAHVLEQVVGCMVDRLPLTRMNRYDVDLDCLRAAVMDDYDLIVLVNPNSPTGRHISRAQLEELLRQVPQRTRVWVDETYVEYAGADQSLERFAARSENVIVCKSLSKVYALSGARIAYLCAAPQQLETLRALTPPWVVGLPSQVAAVRALQAPAYYAERYRETGELRAALAAGLTALKWDIIPGVANFLLCHLPESGPDAATLVTRCRTRGLFIRDASVMSQRLGRRAVRVAVKDAATNCRMLEMLSDLSRP